MGKRSIYEYFRAIYERYQKATKELKRQILDEFCTNTGYNRKYAIWKLNGPPPGKRPSQRRRRIRGATYGQRVISIIYSVWRIADYPCSVRLKEIISLWMPQIRERYEVDSKIEYQLRHISPRQIDRRLHDKKRYLKKRLYGRTKPGTLLKHMIPIKTDNWDVKVPGWTEVDTVAHCGNSLSGEFAWTVNQTDIHSGWVESRAVLGKGERGVVTVLDEMRRALPFTLQGIDSDNGSEFINRHLFRYCKKNHIQPFRGRPYKKNDNAHIEQKNWTHVRRIFGWRRLDTEQAVGAMNDLYRNELRLFMNLFMPSLKLVKKERVGSRLKRVYDKPRTPFARLCAGKGVDRKKKEELEALQKNLNPFELSHAINQKLEKILRLAHKGYSPKLPPEYPDKKLPRRNDRHQIQFGKGDN